MKILLTCNAGMSTSLLVEMMNQANRKSGKNHQIWCMDIEKVEKDHPNCDVLLLGPQVRHTYKRLLKQFGSKIPVAMIPSKEYGHLDGDAVLRYAEQLVFEFENEIK